MADITPGISGNYIIEYRKTAVARGHIENIRKRKFSIGQNQQNRLTQDLHHAVTCLSAELYTKDVHFLMELIQNAEDNEYLLQVQPTLEFVLTSIDITGVGAPATLLVFNNEIGFSNKNIDSLCSIGRSTKKGQTHQGFIGEKGIGFKSVFLVSARPYIFSNGYQIRFSEEPDQDCGIGYIIPEWVATKPTVSDLQTVYGSGKVLPTTTIILPLKPAKVEAVKKQLSEIHPEVLLFLAKIKRLSVRENRISSCTADSVSAISITSETNLIYLRSQGADSRLVILSVQEDADTTENTCNYFIWRQVFPVKPENMVDARKDIKELVISMAFPFGKRLKRGTSSVGIFAFLPTAMVTNFPFIVQADFILASSRENILLDNKWNMGILDNLPSCFVSALTTCMKSNETDEFFSVARVLDFLPVYDSSYIELNRVRQLIKTLLQEECIVPCESFLNEKMVFCKPTDAIRVLPEFKKILFRIKEHNVSLSGISSLGKCVLHNSVDHREYDDALNFIEVPSAGDCNEWYGKCIEACSLIFKASTDVYVELLCFLADNWKHLPPRTLGNIPLVKCITWNGEMKAYRITEIRRKKPVVHLVFQAQEHAWLSKWNLAMGCPNDMFFIPDATVAALAINGRRDKLNLWLSSKVVGVVVTSVSNYCSKLGSFLVTKENPKIVILFSHFIYHSRLKNYIKRDELSKILHAMPVVDGSGNVVLRTKTLVPASGSKWMKLFGSNKQITEEAYKSQYVELGEGYAEATEFAGECTPEKKLLGFLIKHGKAIDLPDIVPQDVVLQAASNQLTSDQALLLLDWIQNLRAKKYEIPKSFLESIRNGKWMKTYSGFNSPSRCFLCDGTEIATLLEMGKTLKVLSAIDEEYYMGRIRSFKDDLMFIGVKVGSEDMYQLIINRLKLLASSAMSGEYAILLLSFIQFSKDKKKLTEDFLKTLKEGSWLKTNKGYMTPVGSVFLSSDSLEALSQISDLHLVDRTYYESQFGHFVEELRLLGILVELEDVYKLIPEHFRFPEDLSTLTRESVLLLLGCIQYLWPAALELTQKVRCQPWIQTSSGFRCPSESLLSDNKSAPFLNVVPLPIINEAFYGSRIRSYKEELEEIGVVVDVDGASKMLCINLKSLLLKGSLTSATVISILNCMKSIRGTMPSQLYNLMSCLSGEKWLKTCHGYKSAPDSILFDSEWGPVSQLVDLPLIDKAFYGDVIYSFKDELKMLGVVVNFSEGAHFVAGGLKLPKEPALIKADSALSLLQCATSLRNSNKSSDWSLQECLLNRLRGSKWLKTHMGYRSPEDSILYNSDWGCHLNQHDAPFVDQEFYGTLSSVQKDDLKAIGVKADIEEVCIVISQILISHTQTCSIMRIYRFLDEFKWSPKLYDRFTYPVWIPDQHGTSGGKWAHRFNCVLHDRNNLFGSRLHALDKYYEKELLPFLSMAFKVAVVPSLDEYLDLWNDWANGKHQVSPAELNSFWEYISENWDSSTKGTLAKKLTMLPATTNSRSVQFVPKEEVFIPDDLQLKKSFTEASEEPLFAWFPQNGFSSLSPTKLYEIYRSIGVRKISESLQSNYTLSDCKFEKMDLTNDLINKALIKILLGFLAFMPVEDRHKTAKFLLELSVFGTEKPITVSYGLQLPLQKKRLDVEVRRTVLWERNSQRLLVHKSSWKDGQKNMEFIASFARAITEAILPNSPDLVDNLCKIIQTGFVCEFREDAVDLLVTENLELSAEDREFLDNTFPPVTSHSPLVLKRGFLSLESLPTPKKRVPTPSKRLRLQDGK